MHSKIFNVTGTVISVDPAMSTSGDNVHLDSFK